MIRKLARVAVLTVLLVAVAVYLHLLPGTEVSSMVWTLVHRAAHIVAET
jgi:hypothetical protein